MITILRYIFSIFIASTLMNFQAFGQAIKIGEHCPDVELNNVINYPASKLKLSDFKGKLLILDFWGTGCTSCIAAFPEMDSLQKHFGDRIQIIMVNEESEDSTLRFFAKRKRVKMPPLLPFVTGDSILSRLFPHNAVPHHVWIDSSSIVRYVTAGYNTTPERIKVFLAGKSLDLIVKKDIFNFDYSKPVIAEGNGRWADKALYYSYIMHSIPAQVGSLIEPNHIYINSASIVKLYRFAFSEGIKYNFEPGNSVILEVKNSFKYRYPKDNNVFDKWAANNSYYYELMIPVSESDRLYQFMQQDLVRYFNATARVEKRKVKCMVLMNVGNINKLKSKGGPSDSNIFNGTNDPVCYFHNYTLSHIMRQLQSFYVNSLPTPFVDGTGYMGRVDITFSSEAMSDFPLLKKELNKYGLKLVVEDWVTNVLVIHESRYKNLIR